MLRARYVCTQICCHLPCFFRANEPRWERVENGATQAGTRHPSPQKIKVNNQDLTSCLRNLIMLRSERWRLRVRGSKGAEAKRVKRVGSNHSLGQLDSIIFIQTRKKWIPQMHAGICDVMRHRVGSCLLWVCDWLIFFIALMISHT